MVVIDVFVECLCCWDEIVDDYIVDFGVWCFVVGFVFDSVMFVVIVIVLL